MVCDRAKLETILHYINGLKLLEKGGTGKIAVGITGEY